MGRRRGQTAPDPGRAALRIGVRGALAALLLATGAGAAPSGAGEPVLVAVAANFHPTALELARSFEEREGVEVRLASASTGALYAQITNGAPYDLLLAADAERPRRLEEEGLAVAGSRFTYARGRLVLWSGVGGRVLKGDLAGELLRTRGRIALASPDLAPYGFAAFQVLDRLGLWTGLADRLVTGASVTQAHQYVASGAAEVGLVAASGVLEAPRDTVLVVPSELHDPIDQQAVLLLPGRERPAARRFLESLRGDEARRTIEAHGYAVEEAAVEDSAEGGEGRDDPARRRLPSGRPTT